MTIKATARLKATAADISNFDDHPKKAGAQKLANRIEHSLRKSGCRVAVIPNKLFNRQLSGPLKGYFFTIKTDAPFGTCVDMMLEAGWSRKANKWSKRGDQSFILDRSKEGVEGSIFFI